MRHDPKNRRLPVGWVWAKVEQVCLVNPRTFAAPLSDNCEVSFVPMAAIEAETGVIDLSQIKLLGDVKKGYTKFSDGDVLFAKITPCMENGKIAIASGLKNGSACGTTELHVLRPFLGLSREYLRFFLLRTDFRKQAQRNMAGTAGQLRVPAWFIEQAHIPLPPHSEQRRIVAEIEKQFTRLDAAEAALRRVEVNLKRYRASVLKAACEGKLVPTEAELSEAEGRDYEHAEQLLKRILAERRAQWESQEKRRGKYKGPESPDISDLPELPAGWVWASLSMVGEVRLGRQRSPKKAKGPNMRPYLRAANVTWDGLDLTDVKEMDFSPSEFETYRLIPGDIVLNEASGSPDEVGKPAVWQGQIERCCFQNTLIRVRTVSEIVPYLFHHLMSDARSGNLGRAARGVGIHHLGAGRTASWTVAIPPMEEQRRIVAELEQRLSSIQQAEDAVEASLKRTERLRQSILNRAFSGKLVSQDADDEPASALLERIREERAAERQQNRRRQSKAAPDKQFHLLKDGP